MRNRHCILISLVLLFNFFGSWSATAQSDSTARHFVRFAPQYLFIRGAYLEGERLMGKQRRQGLVVAPRYYAGDARRLRFNLFEEPNPEPATVQGYGLEVLHKLYLTRRPDSRREMVYLAYGTHFEHIHVRYEGDGWFEERGDDGLMYYKRGRIPRHKKIDRLGAVALFGAQNPLVGDRVVWDIFLGLGVKDSYGGAGYQPLRAERSLINYGYSGAYFLAGFKLGVAF